VTAGNSFLSRALITVWVDRTYYNTDCPSRKLSFKQAGPFPIIRKVGDAAYELKIPVTWKNIHPIINKAFLKLYIRPVFQQQREHVDTNVTPVTGTERLLEVEEILDSRWRGERLQYLVKWRKQPWEEWTWEDRTNILQEAQRMCSKFHKDHLNAHYSNSSKNP